MNASKSGVFEEENGDLLIFTLSIERESENSSFENNFIKASFEVVKDLLRVTDYINELGVFRMVGPINSKEVMLFGSWVYCLNLEDLRGVELEDDLKVFLLTFEAEWS